MMRRMDTNARYAQEMPPYDLWRSGIVLLVRTAKDYLQSAYSENLRYCATDVGTPCDGLMADAGMVTNNTGTTAAQKFAQCLDLLAKRIASAAHAYPMADLHPTPLLEKVTTIKTMFYKENDMDIGAIKFHLNLLLFRLLAG